jgi:hypothetical protein
MTTLETPGEMEPQMSDDTVRDFRVGVTWTFTEERLDEVLATLATLPDEYQNACVLPSGSIEFDVDLRARSFAEARRSVIENVVGVVRAAGLVGLPESVYATDDVSYASWRYVDGRFEE